MKGKYISGFLVALTFVVALFGSGGQAFAAAGGASLSKYFYAEPDEYGFMRDPMRGSEMIATHWAKMDAFLDSDVPANQANYDYYHIFNRRNYYNNGNLTGGADFHFIVRVLKSHNAEWKRSEGQLVFLNKALDKVQYQYLKYFAGWFDLNVAPQWDNTGGLQFVNTADRGDILVIDKFTSSTRYDPANPPSYGTPGYTQPDQPSENPDQNADPDFPVQPTPPDNNWDLIGWLKYLVDWFIYIVKCFVYFLKSFGSSIQEVVTGAGSLIEGLSSFLAFLPNQIISIITMGVVAMIVVGVVKR